MITVKGKLFTYGEAVARLDELKEDLEDAKDEVEYAQRQLDSAEDDVYRIKNEQNELLGQMKGLQDLKQFLPTALLTAGYKLSEVSLSQYPVEGTRDLFNVAYHPPVIVITLEDNRGNVVRQWPEYATLSDLFEVAK